jgi:alpha-amylase/alpha-mannosidase (GH57 family)
MASTVTLGLLLHFYQPPSQTADVLARIVDESYRPLLRTFRTRPALRASVNINAVTTEMLVDHGYRDVVHGLRDLAADGQIELTGSGKYHPILPLIPSDEAARQIRLNAESHTRLFEGAYRPHGFFPPEMAYAPAITPAIVSAGHLWILLSGIACTTAWPVERVHQVEEAPSLSVLFRDDVLSNIISFRNTDAPDFIGRLRALASARDPRYVVIAMDGETYGHHIPGWEEEFLGRLYDAIASPAPTGRSRAARGMDASFIHPATLSEVVERFPVGTSISPRASSWSTTQWDLDHHDPFPLWNHPGNELQRLLWRHLDHTLALYHEAQQTAPEGEDTHAARYALDRAEHSDQFWWASRRPHWSPALVQRGLNIQRESLLHSARAVFHSPADGAARHRVEDALAAAQSIAARVELLLAQE